MKKIAMLIPRTPYNHDLLGNEKICQLEVDEETLLNWFKVFVKPYFKSDSDVAEGLSDKALLEDWLLEYRPEEADTLEYFIKKERLGKEFYIASYNKKIKQLRNEALMNKASNIVLYVDEMFGDSATPNEVIGYYLAMYQDDAFATWMENLVFSLRDAKKSVDDLVESDRYIIETLSKLCDKTYVMDILWNISETLPKKLLSETKTIPYMENPEDVKGFLCSRYNCMPKEFTYFTGRKIYECKVDVCSIIQGLKMYIPKEIKFRPNDTILVPMPKEHYDDPRDIVRKYIIEQYGFAPKSFTCISPDKKIWSYFDKDLYNSEESGDINNVATQKLADFYIKQYGEHEAYSKWMIDKTAKCMNNTQLYSEDVQGILMRAYYQASITRELVNFSFNEKFIGKLVRYHKNSNFTGWVFELDNCCIEVPFTKIRNFGMQYNKDYPKGYFEVITN